MLNHGPGTRRCTRDQVECPRHVPKDGEWLHTCVQKLDHRIFLALLQHTETAAEANVAHDIKTIEVDPIGDAHRGILGLVLQLSHECKSMSVQSWLVFAQGLCVESMVPSLASLLVLLLVTCRVRRHATNVAGIVVPRTFSAA